MVLMVLFGDLGTLVTLTGLLSQYPKFVSSYSNDSLTSWGNINFKQVLTLVSIHELKKLSWWSWVHLHQWNVHQVAVSALKYGYTELCQMKTSTWHAMCANYSMLTMRFDVSTKVKPTAFGRILPAKTRFFCEVPFRSLLHAQIIPNHV